MRNGSRNEIVVSDTGPISNFLGLNRIWLLERLFTQLHVPPTILRELQDGALIWGNRWLQISQSGLLVKESVTNQALKKQLELFLQSGEAEAIALAHEKEAGLLLIDDLDGRRYAERFGIRVMGSVGVLLVAKTENLIDNVRPILDELREDVGFWLSNAMYDRAIQLAGEA